jgi:hypothetical protein
MEVNLHPQALAGDRPALPDSIEAKSLLAQNLNGELEFYRIGRQVNSSNTKAATASSLSTPLSDHLPASGLPPLVARQFGIKGRLQFFWRLRALHEQRHDEKAGVFMIGAERLNAVFCAVVIQGLGQDR